MLAQPKGQVTMTQELEGRFRIVDRRHTASAGESGLRSDIPAGYWPHSGLGIIAPLRAMRGVIRFQPDEFFEAS
jgi:hypothetical protein